MIRRWGTWTVVVLCVASVLVTGCAKKPMVGAGAGTGSSAGAGGTGPAPGGGAGTTAGGGSVGTGGTGTGSGAGTTAAQAGAGTTLPAQPSPQGFSESSALRDLHFDFDRYEVRSQDVPVLEANARWLKANAGALVLIEGHADERGTNEYNLALGERRAKAARDQLVSRGIPATRITLISYGEERPLCAERTEACWARNRRAHFLVKAGQ